MFEFKQGKKKVQVVAINISMLKEALGKKKRFKRVQNHRRSVEKLHESSSKK